jgi:6-phosphogluconolactonase
MSWLKRESNDGFAAKAHACILYFAAQQECRFVIQLPKIKYEIVANSDALSKQVADWLLGIASATSGTVAICLSGGTTPQRLYGRLAEAPYRDRFPWSRTHFFWGDERFVPHDDSLSNYSMANKALLSRAPIPAANIHPIPTEGLTPEDAARRYERDLKSFYEATRGETMRRLFDVMLLGLGEDGHLASLFPGSDALQERERWVVAVTGGKPKARITLTYPALENSANSVFLVAGEEKNMMLDRFRRHDEALPAVHFNPLGELRVIADERAAGGRDLHERAQN